MKQSFPFKLHEMLEEAEELPCLKAAVSWQPHGRAFMVHNTSLFIQEANKRSFFKQTKYPSFQRQLNLYGFQRISAGLDKGAYHHKLFLRGEQGLSQRIQRIRIKGTKVRKPASPANEPDFYSMPSSPPSSRHHDANQSGPNLLVACQTRPPQFHCSPSASTFRQNGTLFSQMVPTSGGYKRDCTVVPLRDCEFTAPSNQSRDMLGLLQQRNAPAILVQPPTQGHLKTFMGSMSHAPEQILGEITDLERHNMRGGTRNDSLSVMPLKRNDGGGPLLSTSSIPRTDMAHYPRRARPRQIARSVSDSPDCTRERELHSNQCCTAASSLRVSDNNPFVLHLQLPTLSSQPIPSKGLTFVRAVDNLPKLTQQKPCIEIDRQSKRNVSDQPVILPLLRWDSDEDHRFSFSDETLGDSIALRGQEGILGLEGLPADTELEEFILALRMTEMDP